MHRHGELRADLGGLLLEMARREAFNLPLLESIARSAVAIETEISELDGRLAEPPPQSPAPVPQPGACERCQGELAAAANFCSLCGAPRGSE